MESNLLWTDIYKPMNLDNIIGNDKIISRFKNMIDTGMIPHMICTGSSGVGKTISIQCLANSFKDKHHAEIININGSEIRSVDILKSKIIVFGKKKIQHNHYRLVIIDEADSIHTSIQHTLRRLVDDFSSKVSFIFVCNLLRKIIEPIQSRCTIFNLTRLSDEQIGTAIENICDQENYEYTKGGISAITLISDGDIRFAINNAQAIIQTFGNLNQRSVYKLCDLPHPQIMHKILDACKTSNIREINKLITMLWKDGYSAIDIVNSIFKITKQANTIDDIFRVQCIKEIGKTHIDIVNGGNTRLQLMGMCIRMSNAYKLHNT